MNNQSDIIRSDALLALNALTNNAAAGLNPVRLLVVGGSSSEMAGGVIGHQSTYELGDALAETVLTFAAEHGIACAFQCCEHLNRALVVERAIAEKYNYEIVCAVPQPKAGGSLATAAWRRMNDPVLVEAVAADAGLDVGQTLIGMHLRRVAVPVRLPVEKIGCAAVTAARTRPKLIGGIRARYEDESQP